MGASLPGRRYLIGRFDLLLPPEHKLDVYQAQLGLHERALESIAASVFRKYRSASAIDVGANVGDSVAAICAAADVPVLCIEGTPYFLQYLGENLRVLPPATVVAPYFLGAKPDRVSSAAINMRDGTASLLGGDTSAQAATIPVRRMADIFKEFPQFRGARLWKLDTDGADFQIISASRLELEVTHPVLFFEYDPSFHRDGSLQARTAINVLIELGYNNFLVYDNFGNLLPRVTHEIAAYFDELNRYLLSHMLFGRRVYYVDVCAFRPEDKDLAEEIWSERRRSLDRAISQSGGMI